MNSQYDHDFYKNRHENTLYSAETILSIVQAVIPEIRSAVDVGCGIGTWLSVLRRRGVTDIHGIDGKWVNTQLLEIPEEYFTVFDLTKTLRVDRTFDLAVSLEVAEHLPTNNADDFVSSLTSMADFVLFSAAVPYQGGIGHINEQWPSYWINLFENKGYECLDFVRKRIWTDERIPFWYRQNILFFVNKSRIEDLTVKTQLYDYTPPETYLLYYSKLVSPGIRQCMKNLFHAVRRRVR